MKKYYDPEYDRIVTENEVMRQYKWFEQNMPWLHETFEQFADKNFTLIERGKSSYYKDLISKETYDGGFKKEIVQ